MFDGGLNFRKHIGLSLVCRSCYCHIRDLRRLDYCNGILYNVTNRELNRLRGVQNCLARVVTRSPRFSRTAPLLKSLHWLPVCFRIKLKICLVTYMPKALCNNQPIYLKEMPKPPQRRLLVIFAHLTKMCYLFIGLGPRIDEGSFSVAAPKLCKNCKNISLFQKIK